MSVDQWTCGHTAGAMCAQCYSELAAKAHKQAEEIERLQEAARTYMAEAVAQAGENERIAALSRAPEAVARDGGLLARQFANMYRSGEQGSEMDCDTAQLLAKSIDALATPPAPQPIGSEEAL